MKLAALIFLCVICLTSCTIERRIYRDGFYVQTSGKLATNSVAGQSKRIQKDSCKAIHRDSSDFADLDVVDLLSGKMEAQQDSNVNLSTPDQRIQTKPLVSKTGAPETPTPHFIATPVPVAGIIQAVTTKDDASLYRMLALIGLILVVIGFAFLITQGFAASGFSFIIGGLVVAVSGFILDTYVLHKLRRNRFVNPEAGDDRNGERRRSAIKQAKWIAKFGVIIFWISMAAILTLIWVTLGKISYSW